MNPNDSTPQNSVKYTNRIIWAILALAVFVFIMTCTGIWYWCGQIKNAWQESHRAINLHAYNIKQITMRNQHFPMFEIYEIPQTPFFNVCRPVLDTQYTFILGHEPSRNETLVGGSMGTIDRETGCLIDQTDFVYVYWQPIYNHSQITKTTLNK